jgi:hypothetical protein
LAADLAATRRDEMKRTVLIVVVVTLTAFLAALAAGCGDSSTDDSGSIPDGQPQGAGDRTAMLGSALDPLVEEGTITEEQEEAVLAAIAANRAERLQGGAPPAAADGQRPAPGTMFSGALNGLVEEGTITPAQQQAIAEALSASMPQRGMGPPGGAQDDATQSL